MTAQTTFGWVPSPAPPESMRAQHAEPAALTAALLDADHAFIERLPAQFTTLWVEDHFQWDDAPTLECFTTMTYLAARHPKLGIGSIVLGQSYRNPALTAKMAATLQVLTGGRFVLGIGAGWKEDEYRAYGYDYPPIAVRIEQLDEAVRIIKALFAGSPAGFQGTHYRIENAHCEPRPNPPIPLLIGGGGERRTLRVVAEHADWWNGNFLTVEQFAHKQRVLAEHCRDVGRDPAAIAHTYYAFVDLSDEQQGARREGPGMHILSGSAASVAAELRGLIDLGVGHIMIRFLDFPSTTGLERFSREVLPALGLG